MISIIKSGGGPASIADGIALTAADCARYDANSKSYREGRAKFAFSSSVYGSSKIKNALKSAQHNKCCYCEAIFEANYAGDVDHYRPKGAIGSGKNRIRPGYYWLAWILAPSATGLSKPDLHVFAKLFEDCLKRGLEAQAFSGREIGGHDDVLDFLVGHFVDVDLTRQPAS
jgi:hypothetical protein